MWRQLTIALLIILIIVQWWCWKSNESYKYDLEKSQILSRQIGETLTQTSADMNKVFSATLKLVAEHASDFEGLAKFMNQWMKIADTFGVDLSKLEFDMTMVGRTGIQLFAESGAFQFLNASDKVIESNNINVFPFKLKYIPSGRVMSKGELVDFCMTYAGSQNKGTIDQSTHTNMANFVQNEVKGKWQRNLNEFSNWAVDPSPTPWNVQNIDKEYRSAYDLLNHPDIHRLFHEYSNRIKSMTGKSFEKFGDYLFGTAQVYTESSDVLFHSEIDFGFFIMYVFYKGGLIPQR